MQDGGALCAGAWRGPCLGVSPCRRAPSCTVALPGPLRETRKLKRGWGAALLRRSTRLVRESTEILHRG